MVDIQQAREDLRKIRIRRVVYVLGGVGLIAVGAALLGLYFSRRELPSLLLGAVSFFWAGMILFQALKTRDLEAVVAAKVDELERLAGETAAGNGEPAGEEEGQETAEKGVSGGCGHAGAGGGESGGPGTGGGSG